MNDGGGDDGGDGGDGDDDGDGGDCGDGGDSEEQAASGAAFQLEEGRREDCLSKDCTKNEE